MRRLSALVICVLLTVGAVAADEKAKPAPAKQSPWLAADDLRSRGEQDAAEALAATIEGKEGAALLAHVKTWRGQPDPAEERKALRGMDAALRARRAADALALADKTPGTPGTILAIRIAMARGYALRHLKRFEESAATLLASADAAAKLGWTSTHVAALREAGASHAYGGKTRAALALWMRCLPLLEERGGNEALRRLLMGIAGLHQKLGELQKTVRFLERTIQLTEAVGKKAEAANLLATASDLYRKLGVPVEALRRAERAAALEGEVGNTARQAWRLADVGELRAALGEFNLALAEHQRSLFLFEQLGDKRGISVALGNLGRAHRMLGDPVTALSFLERSLVLAQETGDTFGIAAIQVDIGNVRFSFGDFLHALRDYKAAMDAFWKMRHKTGGASAMASVATAYEALGAYSLALYYADRALGLFEELGDHDGVATVLGNLGNVYRALGDHERARANITRALALYTKMGRKPAVAQQLDNLGYLHHSAGDDAQALDHFNRALAIYQEVLDKRGMANVYDNIANVHARRKDHAKALAFRERALALWQQMRARASEARTLAEIGESKSRLGKRAEALEALEQALREARSRRMGPLLVSCLRTIARIHLEAGNLPLAISRAQQALAEVEALLGRLSEVQGSLARAGHAEVFEIGALAAARAGDTAEVVTFLESGRAGSLLESLGGRSALRWEDLSETLRRAESVADAKEAAARESLRKAHASGDLRAVRAKVKALNDAADHVADVAARIQREVKGRARDFVYPRADTVEAIQGRLRADQALVLYGLCLDEALAVVLTRSERRIVFLGKASAVRDACAALDLTSGDSKPDAHLATLRVLLVKPLALKPGVKQVLVSPEGRLCYVPFAALFERVVAFMPSGSTHGTLTHVRSGVGRHVLALGDPDYSGIEKGARQVYVRGRKLTRLPATRPEAEAIGDDVLLGSKANEQELRARLATRKHWRAVHFACHGLIDGERPTLSSLAIAATAAEDGFLTALEVLRMDVPADLVVLSACDTGRGKIVKGEGIVGLTRAFMHAGAPRVICSLWKVDDEATSVLMRKFYAYWNPKSGEALSAAVALQKAQHFVRGHAKWKHPYYWAAWVLWGLPD